MAGETVDASVVFLPRLTTLIGLTGSEFTTLPLDVSQYSGAQFQVWRGSMDSGTFTLYLEESLDGQTWVLGASTPTGFPFTTEATKFFSYSFRLRWFRLRIAATGVVVVISTRDRESAVEVAKELENLKLVAQRYPDTRPASASHRASQYSASASSALQPSTLRQIAPARP